MTRHLRPVDALVLGYIAIASVVVLMRQPPNGGVWWVLGSHVLIVVLIALLQRPGLGRVGQVLREVYPILLLGALYGALDIINAGRGTATYDPMILAWERSLFGGQVSQTWWQRFPSPFWSTVFHAAYLSYYLIIPLPPLYFAFTGNRVALRRSVFLIMTAFLICYLFFIFLPVAGPYYQFERPTEAFLANPMARAVYGILSGGSSYGAAFPSSHVAATVAATAAAWWGNRRMGLALSIPTILLVIGVVYTQMHYGVDALAGVVIAGLSIACAWWLERRTSPGAGAPGDVTHR